jgi:hypothetical protein
MSTLPESQTPPGIDEAEEAARVAHYERKQQRKQLPGNRYTAEELRRMAEHMGPFTIIEQEPDVMHLD